MVRLIAAFRSGPWVRLGVAVCWAQLAVLGGAAPVPATRGETMLVSRASGSDGAASNSWSGNASLSANGRVVAFSSTAGNLTRDNRDSREDVFVRDLVTDETTLVTRATGAGRIVPPPHSLLTCASPSVSADGRFVAFSSCARNVHPDDRDHHTDVFVHDLVTRETRLVSRASGADGAKGNAGSDRPSISGDGRFVAFDSTATNLSPNAGDGTVSRVFVRDLATDETTLISDVTSASGYTSSGSNPSLSADGRFVAFSSQVGETMTGVQEIRAHVLVRDLTTGEVTLVSRDTRRIRGFRYSNSEPTLSSDGRFVSFTSFGYYSETDSHRSDVYVHDVVAGETTLISRASGARGARANGVSYGASLSADGRFVTFASSATNLSGDDRNQSHDVYVRDIARSVTTLVSRAAAARAIGVEFSRPSISADGRFITFSYYGDDLSPDDRDATTDVFVRDVRGTPPYCPELERRRGSARADTLVGTLGGEVLVGLGADDRLSGRDGDDCLLGGTGNDRLLGGRGADELRGGPGDDVLDGGPSNPRRNDGRNRYLAGSGNDYVASRNGRREVVNCGPGRDRVRADPSDRLTRCEKATRASL